MPKAEDYIKTAGTTVSHDLRTLCFYKPRLFLPPVYFLDIYALKTKITSSGWFIECTPTLPVHSVICRLSVQNETLA